MTATAPESLRRQRRDDNSSKVTPTKRSSPPVLPYGQHSPLVPQQQQQQHKAKQHQRRYSTGGTTSNVWNGGYYLRQPPAMPLDNNNDGDDNDNNNDLNAAVVGERLLREGRLREREEIQLMGGYNNNNMVGRGDDSNLLFREGPIANNARGTHLSITQQHDDNSQSFGDSPRNNRNNSNNQRLNYSPSPHTPTKMNFFSTSNNENENSSSDQDNSIYFNNTATTASCESPTEEALQQLDAAMINSDGSYNTASDVRRMYEYKRSPSMEPLFDDKDDMNIMMNMSNNEQQQQQHIYRPNKRSLYATLQTVYSMDQGENDTNTAAGEREDGMMVNPMMLCPTYETQSLLIRETTTMSNEENTAEDTCSSTNGVFMEDGAVNNDESSSSCGNNRCNNSSPFRRSTSMQPIFDRDSSEKLSSFTEHSTLDENAGNSNDDAAQYNNQDMSPVEEMPSPQSHVENTQRYSLSSSNYHNPNSPIVYTLSGQPASPLHSEINTDVTMMTNHHHPSSSILEGNDAFGRVCAQLTGVTLSHDSASDDIGGDAYFDRSVSDSGCDAYFDRDDDDGDATSTPRRGDDELMQPIALPPRLKRTTTDPDSEDENVALDFAISPGRLGPHRSPSPMRRSFGNTHSLLDDCSDEEDDLTSVNMNTLDSPTHHNARSYSCFPKKHANTNNNRSSSPYASYLFKKQKPNSRQQHRESNHPIMNSAIVDNNIQKALLETRHRRWSCQSGLAGSHAQSNQVFDVSNRVQYINIRENRLDWNYNQHNEFDFYMDNSEYSDDDQEPIVVLARMSVSHAAIRAGALACGLWRTVRLVKLPRGLFEKHWLMWQEKKHSFEEVYDENGVWALLQMLRETFPLLDQVDFGGDTADASYDDDDDVRTEWTKEIISRVLQILPNLIAIDGFDVAGRVSDVPCSPHHAEFVPMKKAAAVDEEKTNHLGVKVVEDTNAICVQEKSSDACAVCEPVDNMQMCGWTHLVDTQAQTIQEVLSFEVANTVDSELVDVEVNASFAPPEQCSVAREISSDAMEDVSQNILSMIEGCVGSNQERRESYTLDYEPPLHIESELTETRDEDIEQMRASPKSSWEAIDPTTRPPKCPVSSIHRRNPKKLPEKKPSKGSVLKARFKRRVLGIIPSSSVIDEDEDSDGEDNEDMTGECPTDML
eukprot:scaffold60542_cov57-Cyclotella_meneghiniana.AAC.4